MYRDFFDQIRKQLLDEVASFRRTTAVQQPLGIGAAGDKTFPVDKKAEEIIISALESSGISFSLVSEEYGMKEVRGGGTKVIIDPIDGSKNAIAGIPFYCTSIAFAEGETIGSIMVSYVLNLISGDAFFAERDSGAFLNGARISPQHLDEFSLIAYEAQSPSRDIPRILPLLAQARKTRCLGATALDLAHLAAGAVSVFVTPSPSRSFDFAGGWLLVREAGGIFTNLEGVPIDDVPISLKKSTPLLASANQRLHEKALRALQEHKQ